MEVKERIISDLYKLREYMLRHNSFSVDSENLTIMGEFNDLLYAISGLGLTDEGIALDRKSYMDKLNKLNGKELKRYFSNLVNNNQFNRDVFDNYLDMLYGEKPVNAFKFIENLRTFSLDESIDMIRDFFSKCDKDNLPIADEYLDKSRLVVNFKFKEEEDTSGLFRYSSLIDSGYIVLPRERLNLFDIITLAHEMGHAIERKKYIGPQKKKNALSDCLGLEAPGLLYEFKFMDYLLDNRIMTRETLLLYNRLYNLTGVYARNYMIISELDKKGTIDSGGDFVVRDPDGMYSRYKLSDALCYGTDGILGMHLRELEKKDPERFKRSYNNFICSRKEVPYQQRIENLGFDIDEYKSCEIIKPRMLTIIGDTKKAIYK